MNYSTSALNAGYTTLRYTESWIFFNPGKPICVKVSWEGIVKFYEHCWWAGIKLPATLTAVNNEITFVIPAPKAREAAVKLRQQYAHLESVCQLLDQGETWIQDTSIVFCTLPLESLSLAQDLCLSTNSPTSSLGIEG
ncbi:hypothetical protein H6F43_10050 [Leptolyngbya sp. FACHB-36]|uniref:hypothetical protein n=1 Tax=Leptolyngbya sp. FACHB-36 TaxID=2692808 RepID=UPI001681BA04|nr:hypothetical protein [Leptolyngbya sp. FACHB-36]MBD2020530.1 hypothetical protein [Leptolyngbya sp. FACHB-36]